MSIISSEAGDSYDDSNKQFTEILRRSLTAMEKDALEKEMQKNNFLKVRILRDKITSLTRQQNLLSQRYGAMLNRQPSDNAALEGAEKRLDELEAHICDLEVELMALQDSEVQRRSKAIASRQEEAAISSLSSSAILVDNSVMFTARESMSPLTTGTNGGKEKEDQQPMLAHVTDCNAPDGKEEEKLPTTAVAPNNAAEKSRRADSC